MMSWILKNKDIIIHVNYSSPAHNAGLFYFTYHDAMQGYSNLSLYISKSKTWFEE